MPRLAHLTAQIRAAYLAASGATLLSVLLLPLSADAAPVDPVVRAGTATFAVNGNVYTVTNSPNAIIDWRQFNVANGELLRFLQQNPQSIVLNRVTGGDPSQLFGMLQSNGRVLLVNPNGILFGPNASVDVAGLIASTLNLSDADFLAGRMAFSGGGALLQNQGRITTPLGGSVVLLGSDVTNSGVITAPGGRILLAAGQSVSLADTGTPGLSVTLKADGNKALNLGELNARGGSIDLYGALVDQQGIARADSAAVDAHGNVVLKATDAATVSGTVSAANAAGTGGTVQVLGDSVTLTGTARIDASGAQGGGTVLVGGDLHGANAALLNASAASVAAGARIDASAADNGDGGKVVVWSNDKTDYAGSIYARGGAQGGNGGQVETSGKRLSFEQGYVNTLAPKGVTGNWLLDPAVFCFYVSSSSECTGAAAAGATSFNQLGNILVASGGTVQATDFITFLPAGGNASVSPTAPAGLTLNVKAPYIQLGNGSNINTQAVGIRLDASNAYGTTTQSSASGANLTGTIDIGGFLNSNASQTLLATGDINIGHGGNNYTGLNMVAAAGTQSVTAGGAVGLEAGVGLDASGIRRNAVLYSDGAQTINAGKLTLMSGNSTSDPYTNAELNAKGNQTITANEITLLAQLSGSANILASGAGMTQTIQAGTITLTGGSGTSNNGAQIQSQGQQAITATTLTIRGGTGGSNNSSNVSTFGGSGAVQTITADSITLEGGANGTNNYAGLHSDSANPVQSITTKKLTLTGGAAGTQNWAHLWLNDTAGTKQSKQTVKADDIVLQGGAGATADAGIGGNGTQTLSANSISMQGGAGDDARAHLGADGDVAIVVRDMLSMTGGTAANGAAANLGSSTNMSVSAGSIAIIGGASGNHNNANIGLYGTTAKTQTVNVAGDLTMRSGAGSDNWAGIHTSGGTSMQQDVKAGNLVLAGSNGGSGNWVHLWTDDTGGANISKQTVTASTIAITAGGAGSDAQIGGNASQQVTSGAIALTGGSGDNNGAQVSTGGSQRVVVSGGIGLKGGTAANGSSAGINGATQDISAAAMALTGGSAGNNNGANINASAGNQTIAADSLAITGGAGGSNNGANVSANGGTDALQKITVKQLVMTGGAGGTNNIAGLHANGTRVTQEVNADSLRLTAGNGPSDWAHIAAGYQDATPSTQRINAVSIKLATDTSTAADSAANALILNYGTQTIKGGSLTLAAGYSNASIQNNSNTGSGTQSIELTGALALTGGQGSNTSAFISANGGQSIAADSITITAGAAGSGSSAFISEAGTGTNDQLITANRISLTGGGGLNNSAGIYKSTAGKQTVIIKGGGSITLQGGSGEALPATGQPIDYCNGCKLSSNVAAIYSGDGSSQLIDFAAGGTLSITGGARGTGNAAYIINEMSKGGTQTITSSGGAANYPAITLTGGSGGFYNVADGANPRNAAAIGAFDAMTASVPGALKTINAKSITLNGGGTANGGGGALLATGQGNSVINVTGDLVMTGGASNVALQSPATPAKAFWPDFGSFAGITARGNVDLKVGGNLIVNGGAGTSSSAGILLTNGGSLTANIAGGTRLDAGASSAIIATGVTAAEMLPQPGSVAIGLGTGDSFTTSTFASSSKYFALDGTINVIGSAPDAQLVGSYSGGTINGPGWQALGAKPIVAEIYASDGIEVADSAAINTPNGSWIGVLGKNAAASIDPGVTTLSYSALTAHGYQWTPAAYNSTNAQDFRFVLPDNAPLVETHADEIIAQTACTSNPALCVTPPIAAATPASAVAPVVIDVKLTGGIDETPLSASLAQNQAEAPAPEAAPAPKVQGPRVAAREKEQARAEEDKKSTAELKREARDSGAVAKASQETARKAAALAQKEALEAKRIAAAAAKTEAQAAKAATVVTAAEGDLRAAQADARDARAAIGAAATPAQKNQAQLRLATAEAARAGAEAKLAEAKAKRAELGAQGSEAGARRTQAESVVYDAGAREAAAEAKIAGAAHAEALVRAREARDPATRATAQRLADDKRIEATQHTAESDVRQSIADDLRFAAEQGKAQADARQAQAQAALAMAQARRDEQRMQRAIARTRQEDVSGKGASVRTAQGGKEAADKLVAAETKRAEASQAAANAKAQAAESKQRKADEGAAEVARRDDARRERAVKAFVAGASASMTASQLASQAALRHEYKGLLFKDALKVLEQNGRAADLPACGGNVSNNCMPSFAQARMEWPTARPLVRKPVASYLPQIERKVAIVIGINRYADQRIPQLDTAVPDAQAVAVQLESSMGYETRVLQNPTKADIVAALQNVSRELAPSDSLVIYYAGHGYLRPVPKGQPQGYWIPSDGSAASPANWISNTDVSKLLANIPAKQVMLVSDSCYSGTFTREQKVAAAGDANSILARRSVTVMSSGGEEPVSDEGVEGHSIFAWSLMQSIKKVGQVEPGTRVFDATREQVTAAYPQVPQYGAAVSAGHAQGGDYLFETRTYK